MLIISSRSGAVCLKSRQNTLCSTLTLLKEEYNCRQCIFYCYSLNMSSAVKWFIASYKPPPLFHCFMGFIEHSSFLCVCFYFRHYFISWYRARLKACLLWYTTNVELDANALVSIKNTVVIFRVDSYFMMVSGLCLLQLTATFCLHYI